jgi:prophage maintenance system killer protein
MKRLSIPQIVMMHSALIKETGGLDGIRDENLLDSALAVNMYIKHWRRRRRVWGIL